MSTLAQADNRRPAAFHSDAELLFAYLKHLTREELAAWWAELLEANRFALGANMPVFGERAR